MLVLTCPHCGVSGEETEFHPGGEAHIKRAVPGDDDATVNEYLFLRTNSRGVHLERWRHQFGCGKWFHVARCTATLEVFGSYRADVVGPPAEVVARIRERRPGWTPPPAFARAIAAAEAAAARPAPAADPGRADAEPEGVR